VELEELVKGVEDSLAALDQREEALLAELAQLRDLRRRFITSRPSTVDRVYRIGKGDAILRELLTGAKSQSELWACESVREAAKGRKDYLYNLVWRMRKRGHIAMPSANGFAVITDAGREKIRGRES